MLTLIVMMLNLDTYNQNNFIPCCSFPHFKIHHKYMTESISYGESTHGCSVVYMPVVVENTSGGIQMAVVDYAGLRWSTHVMECTWL